MFGADSTESCMDINITDDSVVERTEIFRVILEGPPGLDDSVSLNPTQGVVVIINDDGGFKVTLCVVYGQVYV